MTSVFSFIEFLCKISLSVLIPEQPPLKRCLLEEFDRTDDGSRGSPLNPEKCSPNGKLLKQ